MLLICPRTHPLVAFVCIHGGGSAIDDRHPLWGLLIRLVGLFLQQRVDFITAHTQWFVLGTVRYCRRCGRVLRGVACRVRLASKIKSRQKYSRRQEASLLGKLSRSARPCCRGSNACENIMHHTHIDTT